MVYEKDMLWHVFFVLFLTTAAQFYIIKFMVKWYSYEIEEKNEWKKWV